MQCDLCKFSNPAGLEWCQICGARLPIVICARCYFENPVGHTFCGQCGQALASDKETAKPSGSVIESRATSIVAIVGFGTVVAVASVAFPWYFMNGQTGDQDATASLFNQFASGWHWFPGLPIALIVLSSTMSTLLTMLTIRGRSYPLQIVLLGLVSLASAMWLWLGLVAEGKDIGDAELTPILTTIGAIIVLVGGFILARPLLQR